MPSSNGRSDELDSLLPMDGDCEEYEVITSEEVDRVLDALAEEQIEAQRARHAAAHGEKGITHG